MGKLRLYSQVNYRPATYKKVSSFPLLLQKVASAASAREIKVLCARCLIYQRSLNTRTSELRSNIRNEPEFTHDDD